MIRRISWVAAFLSAAVLSTCALWLNSRSGQLRLVMWQHGLTAGALASGQIEDEPQLTSYGLDPEGVYKLASLSKPITAAAILRLVQGGKLSLTDRIGDATVQQLLQHSGGWDRAIAGDPFCAADEALAKQFRPGTRYAYSNLGYCLLSREIERRSGMSYERYARSVLPKGSHLRVGIPSLSGAGGWVGSPSDYFAFASQPLRPLTSAPPVYAPRGQSYYGLGWRVWPDGTLSHFGYLPGSYSIVFRRGGFVVVGVFSGDPENPEATTTRLKRVLIDRS